VIKDKSKFHKLMDESILIFIVVNILAVLANVSGRFNLARALSNSSALSISLLLALQLIREIVMETLYLHAETHRERGFAGFLDFDARSDKYRRFLGVLTIILWLLSFAWSMSFYDRLYDATVGFLREERTLGEFEFTYGSVLIFVAIIWAAVLVERIISLVFKTEDSNFPGRRKSKAGSWVLFTKLGVYIVGFLLAFAAAGISMDKMAIVLGALSVGIGFGLQNIVNNLVSGIILAVEKPMEVGDVIELGTRMGTVKEIGFRSSQIATYDGSVIIVPNGDFISQQLINWTHSNNNYRRVDLVFGVPYGTDLPSTQKIIMDILESHSDVARYPAPVVLVHQFGSSSVDLRALFWTAEFDKWVGLRSSVLQEVYQKFAEAGIDIPFPQQDLHIRSIDPKAAEALRGNDSGKQSQ
jgi:small-conductance mechanosensitive channel